MENTTQNNGPQSVKELWNHLNQIIKDTEKDTTEEILWEKLRSLLNCNPQTFIELNKESPEFYEAVLEGIMMYAYIGVGLRIIQLNFDKKMAESLDNDSSESKNGLSG